MQINLSKVVIPSLKTESFQQNNPSSVAGFAPFIRGNLPVHIVATVQGSINPEQYVSIHSKKQFSSLMNEALQKKKILLTEAFLLHYKALTFIKEVKSIRKQWSKQPQNSQQGLHIAATLTEDTAFALPFVLGAEVNELWCENRELLKYRYMIEPAAVDVFFEE